MTTTLGSQHAPRRSQNLAPVEHDLIDGLTRFVPEVMADHATPGLTMAVARHGELVWRGAFGSADLAKATPMTPGVLIRGGSMSKLYTGVAILQLVERGCLGLFDPINEHLGELQVSNPRGPRPITIYDLLTFQSGLERDTTDCSFSAAPRLERFVSEALSRKALKEYGGTIARWAAPVGDGYRYSNLGVSLLGRIVELVNPANASFEDYVREHIVAPLGMESTVMASADTMAELPDALAARLSTGYAVFGDVRVPTPTIHAAASPAANLLTTPADHVRLLLALLNGGRYSDAQLLSADTVAQMTTPQVPITLPEFTAPGADWWSGLAVRLNALGRRDYNFGHGGAYVWGWWSDARAYPHYDVAVVIATNGWNMVQWHVPGCLTPHEQIFRYIIDTLEHGTTGGRGHHVEPLAWRLSYLIGLIVAERCRGLLGIDDPLTPAMVDAMARSSDVRIASNERWDARGFTAGALAMAQVEPTPAAIRAFLASDRCALPPREVPALFAHLRGVGELPLPVAFWEHTLAAEAQ